MATIIAKKDLICDENVKRFTKGNEYPLLNNQDSKEITEATLTANDQSIFHRLGNWAKHFKIKKDAK